MKKTAILFFAAFLSIAAFAQNVQEGINHLYAQRYQSARSTFEKLIAANPNNIEASYWLGQTLIADKKISEAKSVYEKAATASNRHPLIVAGLGHIALLEGNQAEARQHFETAINASKGRKGNDPNVLNAVGRANVDAYTEEKKLGDLDYAIAKLTEASGLAATNADIYLNLGNAYRKKRAQGSGGNAIQAYMKAAQINPASGVAPYRSAMLYKTQVTYKSPEDQWKVVLDHLNQAIKADPKFAPAYEELYQFSLLTKRDFAAAENFANSYISNSDPSVENDYLKAQVLWLQGKFPEAISIGKNIIAQTNNNPKVRVYRLLGYSYMSTKDTSTACDYVNQLFTKATEEELAAQDFILHAQSCGRNNPEIIRADLAKMMSLDIDPNKKFEVVSDFFNEAKKDGQRVLAAELGQVRFSLLGAKAPPTMLINDIALNYYFGGAFEKADSAAQAYSAVAPDSIYGHYWSALASERIDTAGTLGLAMPHYEKVLTIAETDKVRFKTQGIRAAQNLAVFYNNVKEDKNAALAFAERGLQFDPTHEGLTKIKDYLKTPPRSTPRQGGTQQKGTSSASPSKGAKSTNG